MATRWLDGVVALPARYRWARGWMWLSGRLVWSGALPGDRSGTGVWSASAASWSAHRVPCARAAGSVPGDPLVHTGRSP